MATCPQCGGFLRENHPCRALWRLKLRFWLTVLLGAAIGALVAVALTAATRSAVSPAAIGLCAVTGAIVRFAYLCGEPQRND